MSGATQIANITINIALDAAPSTEAGFGTLRHLVDGATNTLNGDTVRSYASIDDVSDDYDAGYISASTKAALTAAFSQNPAPTTVQVGAVDLSTTVKAEKDFGTVGTGAFDSVLQAHSAGDAGNLISVALTADGVGSVSITRDGNAFTIHYVADTSTVSDVETAITALAGGNDLVDVKTGGTGATVLTADDAFVAKYLTGGRSSGWDTGLAASVAADDDFYGLTIASRVAADQAAVLTAVEAMNRILVIQSSAASILSGTNPSGLSAYATAERTAGIYHDDDTEWADVAWCANRLTADPDVISAPWDCPIAGVDAYTTSITSGQRTLAQGINWNVMLPYGGEPTFVDGGWNGKGRALYEIETADWFRARLLEGIAALKVAHSNRKEKLTVDAVGQAKVRSVIEALFKQGVAAGHFEAGQWEVTLPDVVQADRDAQRFRISARAQDAVSGRLFVFNVNLSRSPLT